MVTINQSTNEQLPDPSAILTLSVENLTFIRLLQKVHYFRITKKQMLHVIELQRIT